MQYIARPFYCIAQRTYLEKLLHHFSDQLSPTSPASKCHSLNIRWITHTRLLPVQLLPTSVSLCTSASSHFRVSLHFSIFPLQCLCTSASSHFRVSLHFSIFPHQSLCTSASSHFRVYALQHLPTSVSLCTSASSHFRVYALQHIPTAVSICTSDSLPQFRFQSHFNPFPLNKTPHVRFSSHFSFLLFLSDSKYCISIIALPVTFPFCPGIQLLTQTQWPFCTRPDWWSSQSLTFLLQDWPFHNQLFTPLTENPCKSNLHQMLTPYLP